MLYGGMWIVTLNRGNNDRSEEKRSLFIAAGTLGDRARWAAGRGRPTPAAAAVTSGRGRGREEGGESGST